MPHAQIHFEPWNIPRATINEAKLLIQKIVSNALSQRDTLRKKRRNTKKVLATPTQDIYVYDRPAKRSDGNPAPFELVVEAGSAKGRNADKVARLIAKEIREEGFLPEEVLGPGKSCVWVRFDKRNGFCFI